MNCWSSFPYLREKLFFILANRSIVRQETIHFSNIPRITKHSVCCICVPLVRTHTEMTKQYSRRFVRDKWHTCNNEYMSMCTRRESPSQICVTDITSLQCVLYPIYKCSLLYVLSWVLSKRFYFIAARLMMQKFILHCISLCFQSEKI